MRRKRQRLAEKHSISKASQAKGATTHIPSTSSSNVGTEENESKSSSNANSIEDLQRQLALIRDQIDTAQLKLLEKKKPWFKDAATVISLFALLVSLILGWHQVIQDESDDQESKQTQVRDLISRLLDLDRDYYNQHMLVANAPIQEDDKDAFEKKRRLYLDGIDDLERGIDRGLTSEQYVALAEQADENHDPMRGEAEYLKALAHAEDDQRKRYICQFLGAFYFNAGEMADPVKGAEYYQQAIDLVQSDKTLTELPARAYEKAIIYLQWADSAHSCTDNSIDYREESYRVLAMAATQLLIPRNDVTQDTGVDSLSSLLADWAKDGDDLSKAPSTLREQLVQLKINVVPKSAK